MTHFLPRLIAVALLLISSVAFSGAQSKTEPQAQKRLAILIMDGRRHRPAPVPAPPQSGDPQNYGGGLGTRATKPLPNFERPKGSPPLTEIRLRYVMEGEAVRIKVIVVFDDTYPADASGPKYGPVEKSVGTYLAREGDTVKINELLELGYEALELKIVPALEPAVRTRTRVFPEVVNNLKSIELVGIIESPSHQESGLYDITLKNISAKEIVGLEVCQPMKDGSSGKSTYGAILMKPGEEMHWDMTLQDPGGRDTPQGYIPDPPANRFVIGTVVFADDTYDGEMETALSMLAEAKGSQLQGKRILPLLQNLIDNQPSDPAKAFEDLETQIRGLRIDPDEAVMEELKVQFPEPLKRYTWNDVRGTVIRAMTMKRDWAANHIRSLRDALPRMPASEVMSSLKRMKTTLETRFFSRDYHGF